MVIKATNDLKSFSKTTEEEIKALENLNNVKKGDKDKK